MLYNIPSRTGADMPNDLLAELAQIDNIVARQAGQRRRAGADRRPRALAGNDDIFARLLEIGGAGGILVASHLVGDEMRRMVDEPDAPARRSTRALQAVYEALAVAPPTRSPIKAALEHARHSTSAACGCRWSSSTSSERDVVRAVLERHGLLQAAHA